jgi:hypothetical protein
MTRVIYASFDVETDGNNPLQHSMRSIGVALFRENNTQIPIDTFYCTITPQKGAIEEAVCMANFWNHHPAMMHEVNTDVVTPECAMESLSSFLTFHGRTASIKWVANPANFDWMFLKCYYEKYGPVGKYDIGFFCHDLCALMRAYAVINKIENIHELKVELSGRQKADVPHHALHDAVYQGVMYMNLRKKLTGA